jgi:hypothetical protein
LTERPQPRRRVPAAKIAAGAVGVLIVTIAVLLVAGVFSGDGQQPTFYDRLSDDAGFHDPWSCDVEVRTPDAEIQHRWPTATQTAVLFCMTDNGGFVNGYIEYARFVSDRALKTALARNGLRHHRYCVFGRQIVVNGDSPAFAQMCDRRRGVLGGADSQ